MAYVGSRLTNIQVAQYDAITDYVEGLIGNENHEFNCPINRTIMVGSVCVGVHGTTLGRRVMIQLFDYQITNQGRRFQLVDPLTTDTPLDDTTLTPNIALKKAIAHFLEEKLTPKQYRIFDLMLDAYHRDEALSIEEAEFIYFFELL